MNKNYGWPVLIVLIVVLPAIISPFTINKTSTEDSLNTNLKTNSDLNNSSDTTDSSNWFRPHFEDRADERKRMVKYQMYEVEDKKVLWAMEEVPRHFFIPGNYQRNAYDDRPLPIGEGQTISQPFIVAYMTEALDIKPGDKVLEIGTGSGYQAAVINMLTEHVYTLEILYTLGVKADLLFDELGYKTIKRKVADGYYGWEEAAPFDAIIVTCASGHVPPPLIKQLAPGGRMIIPVGGVYSYQRLILVTKDQEGNVHDRNLIPVRFVPMTGQAQK